MFVFWSGVFIWQLEEKQGGRASKKPMKLAINIEVYCFTARKMLLFFDELGMFKIKTLNHGRKPSFNRIIFENSSPSFICAPGRRCQTMT